MTCVQAKVTFDSLHVVRAEMWGFWGEPGSNAEWYLTMLANAGGTGGSYTWSSLLVKDNTDYIIGHDIIVDLPNENSSITIRASGYEHDGSSANDVLQQRSILIHPLMTGTLVLPARCLGLTTILSMNCSIRLRARRPRAVPLLPTRSTNSQTGGGAVNAKDCGSQGSQLREYVLLAIVIPGKEVGTTRS